MRAHGNPFLGTRADTQPCIHVTTPICARTPPTHLYAKDPKRQRSRLFAAVEEIGCYDCPECLNCSSLHNVSTRPCASTAGFVWPCSQASSLDERSSLIPYCHPAVQGFAWFSPILCWMTTNTMHYIDDSDGTIQYPNGATGIPWNHKVPGIANNSVDATQCYNQT